MKHDKHENKCDMLFFILTANGYFKLFLRVFYYFNKKIFKYRLDKNCIDLCKKYIIIQINSLKHVKSERG